MLSVPFARCGTDPMLVAPRLLLGPFLPIPLDKMLWNVAHGSMVSSAAV